MLRKQSVVWQCPSVSLGVAGDEILQLQGFSEVVHAFDDVGAGCEMSEGVAVGEVCTVYDGACGIIDIEPHGLCGAKCVTVEAELLCSRPCVDGGAFVDDHHGGVP